ncbi:MAG: hypothetical protein ACYSW8_31790 [Planctomycetota bacterium]|jgi:hypothetical protein
MSRNILVPDAAPAESETTEATDVAEEQAVETSDNTVAAETPSIPDKYAGKTMEEVVAMHMNAEKEIGRQANEVGTYRDLLKSMSEASNVQAPQTDTTEAQPVEVSSDDLWENPTEAIRSVVQETLRDEIAPIQQTQQEQIAQQQFAQLMHIHPDAETIGEDPEFKAFVEKSPYRLMDAQRWIANRDVDAANRLLSDYKELNPTTTTEKVLEGDVSAVNKARAVSTESGRGSGGPKGQETLSKREVQKVFINDRDLYDSDAYQKKLIMHAARGTLVD